MFFVAISVDDDGKPVASVLEAAHLGGFKTGLVATSRITHATPACKRPGSYSRRPGYSFAREEPGTDEIRIGYAAHVLNRDSENEIAAHEIGYSHPLGSVIDILLGGGRQHFLPASEDGDREDDVNLIEWAKEKGWGYAADKSELTSSLGGGETVSLPFLGLFASSHLAYELDRDDDEQPSLLDMARIALASLEKASSESNKGTPDFLAIFSAGDGLANRQM